MKLSGQPAALIAPPWAIGRTELLELEKKFPLHKASDEPHASPSSGKPLTG